MVSGVFIGAGGGEEEAGDRSVGVVIVFAVVKLDAVGATPRVEVEIRWGNFVRGVGEP